jgi:hypothetical protein
MRQWLSPAQPIRFFARFPRATMSIVPMLISVELGISMIVGYVAARFIAGREEKATGRFPNLILPIKNYNIHLHHWLVFLHILVVTLILHFFVVTPHIFYGFLGGVVAQGVLYYDDWTEIISRR